MKRSAKIRFVSRQDLFHVDACSNLEPGQRLPGTRGQTPSATPARPQNRITRSFVLVFA